MASQPIYQFYAELADYKPKIWRRFQVAGNITMARLWYIIMTMCEMQASHLFCFDIHVAENFRRCVRDYVANDGNSKVIDLFEAKPELATLRIELLDEDGFSAFDIDDMNFRLKKVPRIYSDIYEMRYEPTKKSVDILERKY